MRECQRDVSSNWISLSEYTAPRYFTTTFAWFTTNRVYVGPIPKQMTSKGGKTPSVDRSVFVRCTILCKFQLGNTYDLYSFIVKVDQKFSKKFVSYLIKEK